MEEGDFSWFSRFLKLQMVPNQAKHHYNDFYHTGLLLPFAKSNCSFL